MEVQNLLVVATTTYDAAFLVQTTDDPLIAPKECLQALPAHIRAMASEAICQGATTALGAASLEFGTVVKVQVVQ